MSGGLPAVDVAVAFTETWARHDMAAAAEYLADDVAFEGPLSRTSGAQAYLEALGRFAQTVIDVTVIAALGDDERAMIMYDMTTGPFGTLRAAEYLVVRDGKITSDMLVFDTHEVRKAQRATS
jgi:SnoaL-like domain